MSTTMNLQAGFAAVRAEQVARFRPYTYDHPLVVTAPVHDAMRQLGLVLHKAIRHLAANYERFQHLLPFSECELAILATCCRHPYRVGTFRTDFVIDTRNHIRVIEITTRQPLNGYFTSGVLRELALEQVAHYGIGGVIDAYPRFFDYLAAYIGDARHICVIRGNERLEEFKLYPTIFAHAGMPCHIIPLAQLVDSLHLLEDAWVIEELNHEEIRQFSPEIIDVLARARLHNDLRTILFAHDKRLFYLLGQPVFLDEALDADEQALLHRYLAPTYVPEHDARIWDDAYHHREAYILKHRIMGKSEQVYAGCVTDEECWKRLFDHGETAQMVLQPYIEQRTFTGSIGDEARNDYVAGTLLYFNDEYFGPGLFRASSFPVTNQGDNRKIAQLVADVDEQIPGVHYL